MKLLVTALVDTDKDPKMVRLRFMECLDQEFKFEGMVVAVPGTAKDPVGAEVLGAMSERFQRDVREYLEENRIDIAPENLSREQFLKFWLHWNGIIGWGSDVIDLVEALGWRREDEWKQ